MKAFNEAERLNLELFEGVSPEFSRFSETLWISRKELWREQNRSFCEAIKFDEIVKSRNWDGKVKSSRCKARKF